MDQDEAKAERPRYQIRVALDPASNNVVPPTIAELEAAVATGLAATYGDDFEIRVYRGERLDRD